jgi:ribonuclease G
VWLGSGGFLVIEATEALTAIDVNTGKNVGKTCDAETALAVNIEAAREVAAQLRLRNIGGLVVIDFIDLESEDDRAKVTATLCEALSQDRARTHVLPMSELGLVEMTRQRSHPPIDSKLLDTCGTCRGRGSVPGVAWAAARVLDEVRRVTHGGALRVVHVEAPAQVLAWLAEHARAELDAIERRTTTSILLRESERIGSDATRVQGA